MEKPQFSSISPEEASRIMEELGRYKSAVDFLETSLPQLLEAHPKHWVAVLGQEIVALTPSFEDLFRELDEKGIDRKSTAIRFLDPNPPTLIL
jgi:CII-binding regulator of phage lambda lysogenization HflD